MRWKRYRRILYVLLALDLIAIGLVSYWDITSKIPDDYYTFVGEDDDIDLGLPVSISGQVPALNIKNAGTSMRICSKQKGQYEANVKFLGFLSMKKMTVHVMEKVKLAPYGEPIGIYITTKGLLVLDTGVVEGKNYDTYTPSKNILCSGDTILKWNGVSVNTISQLNNLILQNGDKPAKILLQRKKEQILVRVTPVETRQGTYKIGVWVREDTQGIGTMTYITEDGKFGALGHGITDSDTGTMIRLKNGEVYEAKILNVVKGRNGCPGELEGIISMSNQRKVANIQKNTALGIYGNVTKSVQNRLADQFIDIALKQKIKCGKAYIHTRMEGEIHEYEIMIRDIRLAEKGNKGMIFQVTDQELIRKTGGIVQGMSGSPIIQDGKLIGAVTHVFVNDPTKGYGIFIENMLGQE